MKAFCVAVIVFPMFVLPVLAEEPSYEEKIYEEVIAIKVMVRDMQKQLDELKKVEKPETLKSSSSFMRREADLETLAKIKLPDNPTSGQVEAYIEEIRAASAGQNCFSNTDPQVDMLAKVGPDNFAALLESYHLSPHKGSYHLRAAMTRLAREEHKNMVMDALPRDTFLIEAVVANGWQDDARQILIEGLEGNTNRLPSQWIKTVASFQEPETYEALKNYLIYGSNKKTTYEAIEYLPGIELDKAVSRAWDNVKFQSKCSAASFVPIAVEYGHLDALERAVEDLDKVEGCRVRNARGLIMRFTDARGYSDEIRTWFDENKDKLEFDPAAKKFRIKE